jgi:hypothetical protein
MKGDALKPESCARPGSLCISLGRHRVDYRYLYYSMSGDKLIDNLGRSTSKRSNAPR